MRPITLISTVLSVPFANAQLSVNIDDLTPGQLIFSLSGSIPIDSTPGADSTFLSFTTLPFDRWEVTFPNASFSSTTFSGSIGTETISSFSPVVENWGSDNLTTLRLQFSGGLNPGAAVASGTSVTAVFDNMVDFDAWKAAENYSVYHGYDLIQRGGTAPGDELATSVENPLIGNITFGPASGVPEPSSCLLLAMCGIAVGFRRQR